MSTRDRTTGTRGGAAPRRGLTVAAAICVAAAATGCATTKNMPTAQFTRTESAIKESIEHGARDRAPAEIASAEQHFAKAQEAANDKDYELALLHAEKAEADAKLAEARSERAAAMASLQELQESIRVLREEIDRQLQSSADQG
jgi:chromosome segregation ATPase